MMDGQTHIVVQAAGLTKVFKDFWFRNWVLAVDRLDLEIHRHEVFGLLGPNGSGKTTTIKMMLGLLYPTRGRLLVLGKAPTDVAVKNRIGYLPEESYLYRFLNARETLDYYARLFQIPRQERRRRVDALLEMVGLTREARRRVGEYSKGMARRIGLAQALINDPELLILDEPTTGLDPIGNREIKDLILFLNREKRKTILLCSHLLADVEDVCQRITIMYGGRTRANGPTSELLTDEGLTQITAQRLSEQGLEKVRRVVEEDEGRQLVSVSSPRTSLEKFFLHIVREAQQTQSHTAGATAGGRIADFLGQTDPAQGAAVVESLMAAAQAPVPATPVAPPTASVEAPLEQAEVIDQLMQPAAASQLSPAAARPIDTPRSEEPDRSVIDDLLGPTHSKKAERNP